MIIISVCFCSTKATTILITAPSLKTVTPDLLIAIEMSVRIAKLDYTQNVGAHNERIVGHSFATDRILICYSVKVFDILDSNICFQRIFI